MMLRMLPAFLIAVATPLAAQIIPQPVDDRQRIQRVQYVSGQEVVLTMLPGTPLTVVLEPGESIADVQPGAEGGFSVRVSAERDSFTVLPVSESPRESLQVTTGSREYRFILKVDYGPEAAVLVRYDYGQPEIPVSERPVSNEVWAYSFRGDREVRPEELTDDGIRTYITYAPGQPLAAVFAIGATGEEEVVNGYMRGDVFEIDRVYDELVFRIDRDKATARRNDQPEQGS